MITAALKNMSQDQVMRGLDPVELEKIKQIDPHPEFRAYVVVHEATVKPGWEKIKGPVVTWLTDAVGKFYEKLQVGLKVFKEHTASVFDTGRQEIGWLAGKTLEVAGGALRTIAIFYIKPEFRSETLNAASYEGVYDNVPVGAQRWEIAPADVGEILAVALFDGDKFRPAFPGARLERAVRMAEGGNVTLQLQDVIQFCRENKISPSAVFSAEALLDDPAVSRKLENKTEEAKRHYEEKAKIAADLEREREAHKLARLELGKAQSAPKISTAVESRKLEKPVQDYVGMKLKKFQPSGDPEKLQAEIDRFLDDQIGEFADLVKLGLIQTGAKIEPPERVEKSLPNLSEIEKAEAEVDG